MSWLRVRNTESIHSIISSILYGDKLGLRSNDDILIQPFYHFRKTQQWRIQDFPDGGHQPLRRVSIYYFLKLHGT